MGICGALAHNCFSIQFSYYLIIEKYLSFLEDHIEHIYLFSKDESSIGKFDQLLDMTQTPRIKSRRIGLFLCLKVNHSCKYTNILLIYMSDKQEEKLYIFKINCSTCKQKLKKK